MARVNIFCQVLTEKGWRNAALDRDEKGRIKWPSRARFLIEWRESGKRKREAAGETPSEALEAQRRKRLELEAHATGMTVTDPEEEAKAEALPLTQTINGFLKDIKTFRKKLTWQKYDHVLNLFAEYAAPKSDARDITAEDVKGFLAWRKSKGFDPGTTLYTDRVILHNFFGRLKIDNPVKEVPKLAKFRKRPVAYPDADLKKFFGACTDWDRAFFSLLLASGLRKGEMQTLEWSDLDLARRRVHVTAKAQYGFTPKEWEERTVPLTAEVVAILKKHRKESGSALVFASPLKPAQLASPAYLHDRCKYVADLAGLNKEEWHLHRFRDTAATRWLRAGIDVRTVQSWLGHESLATTQKYLEPSRDTEKALSRMRLPF
jgi:integrase/recombinase XerD